MTTDLTTIGVQLPATLANDVRELAEANERTLSAEVRLALKAHIAAAKAAAS